MWHVVNHMCSGAGGPCGSGEQGLGLDPSSSTHVLRELWLVASLLQASLSFSAKWGQNTDHGVVGISSDAYKVPNRCWYTGDFRGDSGRQAWGSTNGAEGRLGACPSSQVGDLGREFQGTSAGHPKAGGLGLSAGTHRTRTRWEGPWERGPRAKAPPKCYYEEDNMGRCPLRSPLPWTWASHGVFASGLLGVLTKLSSDSALLSVPQLPSYALVKEMTPTHQCLLSGPCPAFY